MNFTEKRLKESTLDYLFVTNTTKECQRVLHSRLVKIGFDIEKNKIFTSLIAARELIKSNNLRAHLMLDSAALEDFQFDNSQNDHQSLFIFVVF